MAGYMKATLDCLQRWDNMRAVRGLAHAAHYDFAAVAGEGQGYNIGVTLHSNSCWASTSSLLQRACHWL